MHYKKICDVNINKMEIKKNLVSVENYPIKCPYEMEAKMLIIHNTGNNASAQNEINYMISNNNQVSYHIAVDDIEAIQGIPLNRNTWNAGDGAEGYGNRNGISIEICYSKNDSDIEKFLLAEKNAVKIIVQLLRERNWDISKVTKHQDYNGKYCPHRTLDLGWQRFLNMILVELGDEPEQPDPEPINGVHGILTSSALRIRSDVVTGTILTTIPNGNSFEVIDIYSWIASDGFRWGWAKYNEFEGYFQYDPNVMHLVGKDTNNKYKMVFTNSGEDMFIHSSPLGEKNSEIELGTSATILEFSEKKEIDGAYWHQVEYLGQVGFVRYKSENMYPTSDNTYPPVDPKPSIKMILTGSGARLRENVVSGSVKETVPNGSQFDVLEFLGNKEVDGYRWGIGCYNGITGYFQYDPQVMHAIGKTYGSVSMVLESTPARLRENVQGNVILVMPEKSSVIIDEFLSDIASDGFRWCKGDFFGKKGYFQYDPLFMYPVNVKNLIEA
ncbi:MAG: N-acetylmuramoyl-L-alanine amidase [Anaerorhabdus sp.]